MPEEQNVEVYYNEAEERLFDYMIEMWVEPYAPAEVKEVVKDYLREKYHEVFYS